MFKTVLHRKVGFQLREKMNVDYAGRTFQAEGTFQPIFTKDEERESSKYVIWYLRLTGSP